MTHEMLSSHGFGVSECYTLTQRDFKYTLVRFDTRVYRSQLVSFQKDSGIIEQSIPGFESIAHNKDRNTVDFDGHPGLSLIIEHLNKRSSELVAWMDGGGNCLVDGILWDQLESVDHGRMRKSRLVSIIKETNAKYKDLSSRFEALEQQNDLLATELAECKDEIESFKETKQALKHKVRVLQMMVDSENRRKLCQ